MGNVYREAREGSNQNLLISGITLQSEELSGSKSLTLKATLSGGKGDVAWQHAQLFRAKLDQNDIHFKFIVKLSKSDK